MNRNDVPRSYVRLRFLEAYEEDGAECYMGRETWAEVFGPDYHADLEDWTVQYLYTFIDDDGVELRPTVIMAVFLPCDAGQDVWTAAAIRTEEGMVQVGPMTRIT